MLKLGVGIVHRKGVPLRGNAGLGEGKQGMGGKVGEPIKQGILDEKKQPHQENSL